MGISGDATDLPLATDSFDVVTCQTLLIHLADPIAAIREMVRVARPGGLVIAVEPNNFINRLTFNSLTWGRGDEELVRSYHFWLCYHRGKIRNGEGDETLGDVLPGHFAKLGLENIQTYCSDKAAAIYPPYDTQEQAEALAQQKHWRDRQQGPWDLTTLRRHAVAGGATLELVDQFLSELRNAADCDDLALGRGDFFASNGSMMYLISGRKPPFAN